MSNEMNEMSNETIQQMKEVLKQSQDQCKEAALTMESTFHHWNGYLETYKKKMKQEAMTGIDKNSALQTFVAGNDYIINSLQPDVPLIKKCYHQLKKLNEKMINSISSDYNITTPSKKHHVIKRGMKESNRSNMNSEDTNGDENTFSQHYSFRPRDKLGRFLSYHSNQSSMKKRQAAGDKNCDKSYHSNQSSIKKRQAEGDKNCDNSSGSSSKKPKIEHNTSVDIF